MARNVADKYRSFQALYEHERADAYRINTRVTESPVIVIAPHGGKIEPGTSLISDAIAGEDHTLYQFEGLKARENRDLHITSAHFDEPIVIRLVSQARVVVTVHGCKGDDEVTYLGGRDSALKKSIRDELAKEGFTTGAHNNPHLQGINPANICNRGRRAKGVQLEISRGLRSAFTNSNASGSRTVLARYAEAIRNAIRLHYD
jgi:phage replication-related protein YjqB (UPF0714/DUF867 family)